MHAQANSIKVTWASTREGGGRIKFAGAEKRLANEKDMNTLVASSVAKATKLDKDSKSKDNSESEDDNEAEYFNLKHLKIGADSDRERVQSLKDRQSQPKLCTKLMFPLQSLILLVQ